MMNGLSQKRYLELPLPTEDDPRSDQQRILDSLATAGVGRACSYPCPHFAAVIPFAGQRKVENNGFPCLEWG